MPVSTIDDDLGQLERDIRALKIEYEQYFGGGRQRPPSDTEWRVEQVIKRHSERGADMNYAQRFRFNNLASTYAKYREVWRKRLKQKEEGIVPRHFGAAARAIEAERARAEHREETARRKRGAAAAVVIANPQAEADKVTELYRALLAAQQQTGEAASFTAERFQQFVQQKAEQLRREKGCEQVEFAVTVEQGQVKLKARVKS